MDKIRRSLRAVLARLRKRPHVEVRYQIVPRDICRMTMAEWRTSPDLVAVAVKALAEPSIRHMLDICRTEHLANYLSTQPMSIEDRAIISARAEGYCIALNNFESLGRFEAKREPLEETFERPEPVET